MRGARQLFAIITIKKQAQLELSSRNNRASDVSKRSSVPLSISFPTGDHEAITPLEVQELHVPEDPQPDQQLLRELVFPYDEYSFVALTLCRATEVVALVSRTFDRCTFQGAA